MILTALIIIVVLLILYNFVQCLVTLKRSKLSTLPLIPLLGHTPYFIGTTEVFLKKLINITNRISSFGMFAGPIFMPVLWDSERIIHMFNSEGHIQKKASQYRFLKTIAKRTLFISTGTDYKESKRVMLEAVNHGNLKGYMSSFNNNAINLVDSVRTIITTDLEFNIKPELDFCVLSMLLETVMGLEATAMSKEEIISFSEYFTQTLKYVVQRGYSFWLYPDMFFKRSKLYLLSNKATIHIREASERLILARKNKFEINRKRKCDEKSQRTSVFIDRYFVSKKDNGEDFTIEDITDDVLTLLGAGFETTVASIGFTTLLLAIHQDIQQRVYEEIDAKMKENQALSVDDLNEFVYLDRVIHEAWRLYPPIVTIGRSITKGVDLPDGGHLKEGADVWFFIYRMHRDPKFYENPSVFNPDNFLAEKVKQRPPEMYIPFGFGSRKCFGNIFAKLVIKVTICHLLKNYSIHTTKTEKDFRLSYDISLNNLIGFPVSFKPRTEK